MQSENDADDAQRSTKQHDEHALIAKLRDAEIKQNSRRNQRRHYFSKLENKVAFATLVAVIAYTGITLAVFLLQIEANGINRAILQSTASSYVYFGAAQFRLIPQPDNALKEGVFVGIGNSGGATTRKLEYRLSCKPVAGPVIGDPFDQKILAKTEIHYISIAPKQPDVNPQACALSSLEFATANLARLSVYVFGEASYEDTANRLVRHHIEFCTRLYNFAFVGAVVAMSDYCGRHNCTDDECTD